MVDETTSRVVASEREDEREQEERDEEEEEVVLRLRGGGEDALPEQRPLSGRYCEVLTPDALENTYRVAFEHRDVMLPLGPSRRVIGGPRCIKGMMFLLSPLQSSEDDVLLWIPKSGLVQVNPGLLKESELQKLLGEEEKNPGTSERERGYTVHHRVPQVSSLELQGPRTVAVTFSLPDAGVTSHAFTFPPAHGPLSHSPAKVFADAVAFRAGLVKQPHAGVWVRGDASRDEYRNWLYGDAAPQAGAAKAMPHELRRAVTGLVDLVKGGVQAVVNVAGGSTTPPRPAATHQGPTDLRSSISLPHLGPPPDAPAASCPVTSADVETILATSDSPQRQLELIKQRCFSATCDPQARRRVWRLVSGLTDDTSEIRELQDEYIIYRKQHSQITEKQRRHCMWLTQQEAAVNKDVWRTDRDVSFFSGPDPAALRSVRNILLAYCMYNRDLGYVQGMSDIAAVCIFVFSGAREDGSSEDLPVDIEAEAFAGMCWVMDLLLPVLSDHGADERQRLQALTEIVNAPLAQHLSTEDPNSMFAFRWLFLIFKREFQFFDVLKLWDVFFCAPVPRYHLILAASLLHGLSDQLFPLEGAQIVRFLQSLNKTVSVGDALSHAALTWKRLSSNPDVLCILTRDP